MATREIGVKVQALGVREPDDFDDAFTAMNREIPQAILMVSDSLTCRLDRYAFAVSTLSDSASFPKTAACAPRLNQGIACGSRPSLGDLGLEPQLD